MPLNFLEIKGKKSTKIRMLLQNETTIHATINDYLFELEGKLLYRQNYFTLFGPCFCDRHHSNLKF